MPVALVVVATLFAFAANAATSILFIGNSFTYAQYSPARFYRAGTVTDLNGEHQGGVPAIFKAFTQQAGLDYDVSLEAKPGAGLDFHLNRKLDVIGRAWDTVVMHGHSTLDEDKPGDPALLIDTSKRMAVFLRDRNPAVDVYLMATFPRADQTYPREGAWSGQPIEAMARDVRSAYDRAAEGAHAKAVIPVGDAWIRAMHEGVADPNPYDGIAAGELDLWAPDHYHASVYGNYLQALVIFGLVTGRDPRSLGENERAGFELGLMESQVKALQRVAFEQLEAERALASTLSTATKH